MGNLQRQVSHGEGRKESVHVFGVVHTYSSVVFLLIIYICTHTKMFAWLYFWVQDEPLKIILPQKKLLTLKQSYEVV